MPLSSPESWDLPRWQSRKEVHGKVGSLHGDIAANTHPGAHGGGLSLRDPQGAPLPGFLLSVLRGSPGSGSAREHLSPGGKADLQAIGARDMLLGYQATGHPKEPAL